MLEPHIFEWNSGPWETRRPENGGIAQCFDSSESTNPKIKGSQSPFALIATLWCLCFAIATSNALASEPPNDDFLRRPKKNETSRQRCESILARFKIPSPFAPKASLSEKKRLKALEPTAIKVLKTISRQSRHPELQTATPFEQQKFKSEHQYPLQDFLRANGFAGEQDLAVKDLAVSPSGKLLALTKLEKDANGYSSPAKYILFTELDAHARPKAYSSIQLPEGQIIESSEFSIIDNAPVFRVHVVDDWSQSRTLPVNSPRQNIRFYSERSQAESTSLSALMKLQIRRVLPLNENFFFVETEHDQQKGLVRYQLVKVRSLKTEPEIVFQSAPFSKDNKNADGVSVAVKSAFATVNSMRDSKNISVIESSDEIILATNTEFVSFLKDDGTPVGLKSLSHQTENLDEAPMVWNQRDVSIRSQYFSQNYYTKLTLNFPNGQFETKGEISFQISGQMSPKFYLTKTALIGQSIGNLQKGLVVFALNKTTPNARQLTDSGISPDHWQVINNTLYALVSTHFTNKPQLVLRIIPLQ